ncbi:MAG: hypothetical protein LBT69_01365 [Lactobacillales bacterium]|nr:hypothetical protein [Lactobacillales bacterium]
MAVGTVSERQGVHREVKAEGSRPQIPESCIWDCTYGGVRGAKIFLNFSSIRLQSIFITSLLWK